MWLSFTKFALKATITYLIVLALYVLLWRGIVSGLIPSSFNKPSPSNIQPSLDTSQTVKISTEVDVEIYRYVFLPVYWSRLGNLMPYHQTCFALLTIELVTALALKFQRLTLSTRQKLLKPKPSIPIGAGEPLIKSQRKNATRIVVFLWAVIGFLWFITYQLISTLPADATSILIGWIELLNLFMWITMFASIGVIVIPYIKTIYYKIWEGGEKHE